MLALGLLAFVATVSGAPRKSASLPEQTFDAVWTLFDRHYASFPEKKIDWHASYATHRALVSDATTDDELFEVITSMLRPLNDAHVKLTGPGGRRFSAGRQSTVLAEFASKGQPGAFADMVNSTLRNEGFEPLRTAGPVADGRPLFTYTSNARFAYLRFTRCYARPLVGGLLDTSAQQDVIDAIFAGFSGKQTLIIDVRFNLGGHRNIPFAVAARIADKPFIAHYRQDRNGPGHEDFGALSATTIKPQGRHRFPGRVIVLTNDQTTSAADEFALAMRQLPQVTLVGENSNGSFSDSYPRLSPRKLPNGWTVELSNQRYFSPAMINYEGVGVPVDVEVRNEYAHIDTVGDVVLLRALEIGAARPEH